MRNFFRGLERYQVRYLLVSGQAAVLYGAALFSEDIDLWVEPSEENWEALHSCLREQKARYHKLTPPLTTEYARKGHGFHFLVPCESGEEFYLDIMGQPPRVASFPECMERAASLESEWGRLPVIGISDLVEIKKTQRLRDYPVISRLALQSINVTMDNVSEEKLHWAWQHLFELDDAERFASHIHVSKPGWLPLEEPGRTWMELFLSGNDREVEVDARLEEDMLERMAAYRRADRFFWQEIITELRLLRSRGKLCPEGENV
jgi:hypothetical protein